MPQAVKSDPFLSETPEPFISDGAIQREMLRSRRMVFREEAERARRMMANRELWLREDAALRLTERRRMYRIAAGWLGLLLVGIALASMALPDLVEAIQTLSWYPRVGR